MGKSYFYVIKAHLQVFLFKFAESLADYKRLRGGVEFVTKFPLTSIGKIVRREIADMVKAELKRRLHINKLTFDDMYCEHSKHISTRI